MNEIVINFALVVIASVYCGMLIGKRGVRKEVDKAVAATLEKVREREQVLAAELHGELGKVRESIIASARAYQSAVRAIDTKLAPPAAFTLGDKVMDRLPETLENGDALDFEDADSNDSDDADEFGSSRTLDPPDAGSVARSRFILGAAAARNGGELSDFRSAVAQSRATTTELTSAEPDVTTSDPEAAVSLRQIASSLDLGGPSVVPTSSGAESAERDSTQALSSADASSNSENEVGSVEAEEEQNARSVG